MTEANTVTSTRRRRRRILTIPNLAFLVTTVAVFVISVYIGQTNVGVFIAAMVASSAGALVWWASTSSESRNRMSSVLVNLPMLGAIPTHRSAPAPTLAGSDVSEAYGEVLGAIEGQTHGRVLMVSSAESGQGASTVAMNLAIAATKAGRRVALIDGDTGPSGLSRFMSSGVSPGLTDIAAGTSIISDAARMWKIGDSAQLPVIPSGAPIANASGFGGINISDAIESVAERADLLLIDAPPVLASEDTTHLATHADGTILVVTDEADATVVAESGARLSEIGAPALGYVIIRADKALIPFVPLWKPFAVRVAAGAMVLLGLFTAVTGAQLLDSWNSIEREEFSLEEARAALNDSESTTTANDESGAPTTVAFDTATSTSPTTTTIAPLPDQPFNTLLLIGADADSGASDVILYLVMPTNGADPFMMSFPRDLYVENPCTGGRSRINALSHGCKSKGINGGTLLSLKVSDMTGIEVDHFAEFDFEGFKDIVDAVGGIEICVGDYPVRDIVDEDGAQLQLPAGCLNATGEQALSWSRSRKTQILKDGVWRRMPGASDLMRNQHQQDAIFELAGKLKSIESPQQLTQLVASLADAFTLSESLSLTDAISLAWGFRDVDVASINRLIIPVKLSRSPTNQSILIMTLTPREVIAELYGDSLPNDGS